MRRAFNLSAKQTAGLCILGGLIGAVGFLLEIPVHTLRAQQPCTAYWLWASAVITVVIVGFAIALRANSNLQNGIAAARWSDREIESLRSLLSSRSSNLITNSLLALMFVFLALSFTSDHQLRPIFWAFFILHQTLIWLRNTARRQASSTNRQLTWNNISPLRSDHWGQH